MCMQASAHKWFDAIEAWCTTLNGAMTTNNDNVAEEVQTFNASIANLPLTFDFNSECDDEFKLNSMLITWPYLTGALPHHLAFALGCQPRHRRTGCRRAASAGAATCCFAGRCRDDLCSSRPARCASSGAQPAERWMVRRAVQLRFIGSRAD
jgi:hypothetical protein